jgi:3',5'-cyclic-AMP phosphodiesterase
MKRANFYIILASLFFIAACSNEKKYDTVKFGICSDVHLPTMHDSEYRLQTFIDSMNSSKPDFIIVLGDFGTPDPKYGYLFDIWNSFSGDKYHVIGNHEMDGGYSLEAALEYRKMNNSYYSFNKNGFHFIVLDGNDKIDENATGYKQFIGIDQQKWLINDLNKAEGFTVIFSHQGLTFSPGAEQKYGVKNSKEIQKILENHNAQNPKRKVIACFNGHTHYDYAERINNIWYVTINSMSYQWMGEEYKHVRYSQQIDKEYKWIKYTAPHKEPLFTIVEISSEGFINIAGKKTEWVGPSPWELGYPDELKEYVRPAISEKHLKFKIGNLE